MAMTLAVVAAGAGYWLLSERPGGGEDGQLVRSKSVVAGDTRSADALLANTPSAAEPVAADAIERPADNDTVDVAIMAGAPVADALPSAATAAPSIEGVGRPSDTSAQDERELERIAIVAAPEIETPRDDPLDKSLDALRKLLNPALGRVSVGIMGGNRVVIGREIKFEATSTTPGRLLIFDINAAGEVTQIFPNKFVMSEKIGGIATGQKIEVPGPGYGFTGFRAVEPVGEGKLLALIVPPQTSIGDTPVDRARIAKGFEAVSSAARYVENLTAQVASALSSGQAKTDADLKNWGLGISDYEIVR